MSLPPGRPKEGSLPPGGKARSAKGAHICLPPGRPKEGSLPPGGKARSAKGAHICLPPGRPKEGSLPLGGKARSAKGAHHQSIAVMILAAGRGERMRPLSDAVPKPLLMVGGKPLIVWQIEALARAGLRDIVINAAHLADQLVAYLDDGRALGVTLRWSLEPEPLEVAGGIATALPLLPSGPVLIVSADVWNEFDYASLAARAAAMKDRNDTPRVHLVMVPNPVHHPGGDFVLAGGRITAGDGPRLTYGNIGLYDTALFGELPRGSKLKITPFYHQWIGRGLVSGELYTGPWANVGTPDDLARLDSALRTTVPAA